MLPSPPPPHAGSIFTLEYFTSVDSVCQDSLKKTLHCYHVLAHVYQSFLFLNMHSSAWSWIEEGLFRCKGIQL